MISKISQLVEFTASQPSVADEEFHAELSAEGALPVLAHGSAQGLWMLLLSAWLSWSHSLEQGKGLTHPPVGVSSCTGFQGHWNAPPTPSWFLSELYLSLVKTKALNWH